MTSNQLKFQSIFSVSVVPRLALTLAFCAIASGCGTLREPNSDLKNISNQNIYRIGRADIEAWGALTLSSCSYYTTSRADLDVTIRDESIAWGSKVYLLSGLTSVQPFNRSNQRIWDAKEETEMTSVSDFTWKSHRSAVMVERGRAEVYDSVSFLIKVVSPTAEERYIKPSQGQSYLNATFDLGAAECRRDGQDLVMRSIKLQAVNN